MSILSILLNLESGCHTAAGPLPKQLDFHHPLL
jgi:hypothetical protein